MAQESTLYSGISVEDYLRIEEASPTRHEYVAGHLHAMAGVSKRHNKPVFNLVLLTGPVAEKQACSVFISDVKVMAAENIIYYPDLAISCDARDQDA